MTAPDRNEHLDRVVGNVAEIVEAQQCEADPAHEDFYAWGYALSEMTYRLAHVCRVLERQIAGYGDNRILRDDEEGVDPAYRVSQMRDTLGALRTQLEVANVTARAYHSEASHLAVAVNPDADPSA